MRDALIVFVGVPFVCAMLVVVARGLCDLIDDVVAEMIRRAKRKNSNENLQREA